MNVGETLPLSSHLWLDVNNKLLLPNVPPQPLFECFRKSNLFLPNQLCKSLEWRKVIHWQEERFLLWQWNGWTDFSHDNGMGGSISPMTMEWEEWFLPWQWNGRKDLSHDNGMGGRITPITTKWEEGWAPDIRRMPSIEIGGESRGIIVHWDGWFSGFIPIGWVCSIHKSFEQVWDPTHLVMEYFHRWLQSLPIHTPFNMLYEFKKLLC